MSRCINCGSEFAKIGGRIRRYSVQRLVNKSNELRKVLTDLLNLSEETLTPLSKSKFGFEDRSLCNICFGLVDKIEKRKAEITEKAKVVESLKNEFLSKTSASGYLGTKQSLGKRQLEKQVEEHESEDSELFSPRKRTRKASFSGQLSSSGKKRPQSQRTSFRLLAIRYIQTGQYKKAMSLCLRKSDAARRQFLELMTTLVRKEMSNYFKKSEYTAQMLTMECLETFSWKKYLGETRYHLPIIHRVIDTAVCTQQKMDKVKIDDDGALGPLVPGVGLAVSLILHLRKRKRFRLVQSIMSAQMYRSGCSQKLQSWFNKAGLCLSVSGTFTLIDRLTTSFDRDAHKLKHIIEVAINPEGVNLEKPSCEITEEDTLTEESSADSEKEMIHSEKEEEESTDSGGGDEWLDLEETEFAEPLMLEGDSGDGTSHKSQKADVELWEFSKGSRRSLEFKQLQDVDKTKESAPVKVEGYTLTWDNVQKLTEARHQTSEKTNTFQLWALAFMAKNRIHFHDLNSQSDVVDAGSIPLSCFLPSEDDWLVMKNRICIIAQRIIIQHFTSMKEIFEDCVEHHIKHQYSTESAQKSQVINLGVFPENPATTKGVVRILKNLNKYIPEGKEGAQYATLVNGDQLSVERMVSARLSMASSCCMKDRFAGVEPCPQEFHKRCLLLQDTMDMLYSAQSVAEKGTLYQIRNKFLHKGVKKHVMDCVNHVVDFMNFTTEGMLCLMAMKVGNMGCLSDKPEGCPDSEESYEVRQAFFNDFVGKLVECCWPNIYKSTIVAAYSAGGGIEHSEGVDEADLGPCHCNGTNICDTFTIECSARDKCGEKRYYHPTCVKMEDALPEEDWWCSTECEKYSSFCFCKQTVEDRWIGCESGALCIRAKQGWFHLKCVGLKTLPRGDWYCCEECRDFCRTHSDKCERKRFGQTDHVLEYSCAVLFEGLWHMAHKDAERENDGPAMLTFWKLDMVKFWENHHYKYLILGHRLLTDVNGFVPPRLQKELTWNRVANMTGGKGHNIALDLVNEFLNNDFKENLKRVRGRYTEKQVERTSHMIGTVSNTLDDVFQHEMMAKYIPKSRQRRTTAYNTDIQKFVEYYRPLGLYDHIPGRQHKSFPEFSHNIIVHKPGKLRETLIKHSRTLDMEKKAMSID